MIRISRLALIAVAAAGIASPALAQSFDPDVGTGNIVPFSVGPATASVTKVAVHKIRHRTVAARQSGANAFAMVPGSAGGSAFSPAANGGGSVGYNENLRRDQW
jgi:hypothetical protein